MKKIIFLLFLIPVFCNAQIDSSKIKTAGIVLKGKDCDMILNLVKEDVGNFPDLDSLLKLKYRNPPSNNTDVTLDSIPNRQWLKIATKSKNDIMFVLEGVYKNIDTELRLHGTAWIISRMDKDKSVSDKDYDTRKKVGQKYGKRLDDEDQ